MSDNAKIALEELVDLTRLKSDFDAYCYDVAMWGLGKKLDGDTGEWTDYGDERVEKPKQEDYGL